MKGVKGRYKLIVCSKCFTVKAIDAGTWGMDTYCAVCKDTVPVIELDISVGRGLICSEGVGTRYELDK